MHFIISNHFPWISKSKSGYAELLTHGINVPRPGQPLLGYLSRHHSTRPEPSSVGANMNSSTVSMPMAMTPWLHFGSTDYLIFEALHPSSHGAIAGACIGLFLFCILERCLAAYRRTQELRWRTKSAAR